MSETPTADEPPQVSAAASPQYSADRLHWWDGYAWHSVAEYPPTVPVPENPYAARSVVFALLGLVLCGIAWGPFAVMSGLRARREIRASLGTQRGYGRATFGLVVGALETAVWVLGGIWIIYLATR